MAVRTNIITMRQGNKADYQPSKMQSGELAVINDTEELHFSPSSGKSIRVATEEDLKAIDGKVVVDEALSATSTNPVQNKVVTAKFSELLERIDDLQQNGTGLTADLKSALKTYFTDMQTLFTQVAYKTDSNLSMTMIANAQAVVTALDSTGEVKPDNPDIPDTPDEPDEPTKTLSSIEVTYTGGNVPVGTNVSDLTGIVVIATYSDESTAVVTDYTLSGEIVEGENVITVTYEGLTATFTVTGYVASTDEEWTVVREIGENYETGYIVSSNGDGLPVENESWYTSDYIEVPEDTTSFTAYISTFNNHALAWYDADKTLLGFGMNGSYSGTAQYGGGYTDEEGIVWNVVPTEARYCRVSWRNNQTVPSLAFRHNLKLDEDVTPVYNKLYYYIVDTTIADAGIFNVEYLNCESMAYAHIRPIIRRKIEFYDANHSVVSTLATTNNTGNNVSIPEGAKYIKFATPVKYTTNGNSNITYSGYGLIKFTETELTAW